MPTYQGFYNGFPICTNSGGSGSGYSDWKEAPDPYDVYRVTRPRDWFTMPIPAENEIYLLVLVPDKASALLAFTVTCTGNYTVELGSVHGDRFISRSSSIQSSGSRFETEFIADNLDGLTSDGMKQVMIKVSGTDILTWETSPHSKRSNFSSWNIVDIRCNLPKGTSVGVASRSTNNNTLVHLRYFSWEGPNDLTSASYMFTACFSLIAILELDTSKVTDMSNMFRSAYCITAIPHFDTSMVTNMSNMFSSTMRLSTIPEFDMSKVIDASYMFQSCSSLVSIPELDLSSLENMANMFNGCRVLVYVPDLNTKNVTNMSGAFSSNSCLDIAPKLDYSNVTNVDRLFNGCTNLKIIPTMNLTKVTTASDIFTSTFHIGSIKFDQNVSGWDGCDIRINSQSMGYDAIMSLIRSLPTISTNKTLTLTGNYGLSSLTADDEAIATRKNWTIIK